jgi:uncharacterized protein (DUF1778 family)
VPRKIRSARRRQVVAHVNFECTPEQKIALLEAAHAEGASLKDFILARCFELPY